MSELHRHELEERIARERPEVSARRAELVAARAKLVGELRGIARGLRLGRLALRLIGRLRRGARR